MTDHGSAERHALADLLMALGPGAPTLCTGWTTAHLAAHLVVREGDLLGAAGIVLGPLAHHTRRAMDDLLRRTDYATLVERVRSGPPRWSPARLGVVGREINTTEFFVHHEDVRRAQPTWQPRQLPDDLEEFLWRRLTRAGRFLFRRAAVGVLIVRPDGTTARVRGGEPTAVLEGKPSELTLYGFGRKAVADVALRGPSEATEALAHAPFGM
jgi:uncharacterized protein (TIGR03085 family)